MPLPSTRSSSGYPVGIRSCSSMDTSSSFTGFAGTRWEIPPVRPAGAFFATGSSTSVFHSLHAGHCPSHLLDSKPHSLQKKTVVFAFAMLCMPFLKEDV